MSSDEEDASGAWKTERGREPGWKLLQSFNVECADGEWISEREEIESSKLKVESEEEKKESPHAALPFATLGKPENKGMQVMRMASGTC
ncbi:MAG TPA: hypothetical protein VFQ18_01525 [Candidatus Acidoferrum sp.]|nr:hypothetical protein [Candidatus Acidoferrum sp.]